VCVAHNTQSRVPLLPLLPPPGNKKLIVDEEGAIKNVNINRAEAAVNYGGYNSYTQHPYSGGLELLRQPLAAFGRPLAALGWPLAIFQTASSSHWTASRSLLDGF
jgi:hypothetical protein